MKINRFNFWVVIAFVMVLVYACQYSNYTNNKFLTHKLRKEIALPLPKGQVYSPNIIHSVIVADTLHLLIRYFPKLYICDYNTITQKLVRNIPLPHHLYAIKDFNYLNEDSILIFGESDYKYNNDSAIVLSNTKGEIIETWPLNHPQIISSFSYPQFIANPNDTSLNDSSFDSIIFPSSPFGLGSSHNDMFDRIYMTFENSRIGNSEKIKPFPLVGYYDYKNKGLKITNQFFYPNWEMGEYLPNQNYECDISSDKHNNFLISFKNSSLIYRCNADLNIIDTIDIKSEFVKLPSPQNKIFTEESQKLYPSYGSVFYLSKQKMYMRHAFLSKNIRLAIFTDEQFNYIGESTFDYRFQNVSQEGIQSWEIDGDSLYLSTWGLEFGVYSHEILEQQIEALQQLDIDPKGTCSINSIPQDPKKSLSIYAQQKLGIQDKSYSLVVVNKNACPSCVDYVMQFLSLNKHALFGFKDKPLYLVYRDSEATSSTLTRDLKLYNLDKNQGVFVDTTNDYNLYNPFKENSNPRLYLFQDQKVRLDTIYNPADLEDFPNQLLNFYGLK